MESHKEKRVLFAAGEVWPFIKTGGLGDVAYSLPKALKKDGVDVRVILPYYNKISEEYKKKMKLLGHKSIKLAWREEVYLGIRELELEGIKYYFVENQQYFNRHEIYGEADDCERFTFFCKSIIESFEITGFLPNVIHCNDWHTGVVPLYLEEKKKSGLYTNIKTVFTIHNLRFQGCFPYYEVHNTLGVDPNIYFKEEGIKFHNSLSFMKSGVNYSDVITTVSESYAKEIMTPYYGEQLDGLFITHKSKLHGILNGIDYEIFNPETDNEIIKKYNIDNLDGKIDNKYELQKYLKLEQKKNIPVISIVTRLDRQKGIDLIMASFDSIMKETPIQFILLGNGEKHYEEYFKDVERRYPDRVRSVIGFSNELAKKIYAGSDLFLMPSQFEPCGLSQLISLRYGTIPVVRETGGLQDTVEPYNEYTKIGNGFSFKNYNAHDMINAIKYAIKIYNEKESWEQIMKNAMNSDNSWEKSALKYLKIYKML